MDKNNILALAKEAKNAINVAETSLSNRVKVLAAYAFSSDFAGAANGLQAVRKWAKACGFQTKKDFNPEMVLTGWKLVDGLKNETKLQKTPIYRINEDKSFYYEETTNKKGQKQYKKVVDFYVFEPKTTWTLNDVIDSICNYQLTVKPKEFAQETPYAVDENGKLVQSDNAEFVHRALNSTRLEEELARLQDAEEE